MPVQPKTSKQHCGRLPSLRLVAALLCGCNSNQVAPECAVLVPAMSELSERLAAARGVLAEPDVEPALVSEVLRPFAGSAKKAAERLTSQVPRNSKLRKLSERASAAANTLGVQAAQMAEYANQMSDLDAANKAVDQSKQRVDELEPKIRQTCEANPTKCTELSGVLARFPAPTDQTGMEHDMAAWAHKVTTWARELESLRIADKDLDAHVTAFRQGWQEVGTAMSRLVTLLEVGKKYEGLNREFNTQIEKTNQAIAETNASCQSK